MLFMRLSWPPNELAPEVCGVRRVKSPIRPVTVGSVASVSRFTDVAAPVRAELNTALDSAVTVTVSVTAIGLTSKLRSVDDAEVDLDVLDGLGRERRGAGAGVSHRHRVRAADAHVEDEETAISARRGFVGRARGQVNRNDAGARHGLLLSRLNYAVK